MSDKAVNADAWQLPGVLSYFHDARSTTDQIYPSEWKFLEGLLEEGMSVLDVGCAQGGLAQVLGEHLSEFEYTGLDVSEEMVRLAKERQPHHAFHQIAEGCFDLPLDRQYDLVTVLGILHLHESWRDTLRSAWEYTGKNILFDLREWHGATIENKSKSYMTMSFASDSPDYELSRLPYIILNEESSSSLVHDICRGYENIQSYGYAHAPTSAAVTPVETLTVRTWCVGKS